MERQIAGMSGHYIVCGVGRVGSNVAQELLATRRPFVVIEQDEAVVQRWHESHHEVPYLHADAADDDALRHAGVARAAGVFAVTADDSHNLMVALSVKLLNPAVRVVVRLHDIRNADKARRAGADEIVSPDFSGGMRIASAMLRPHVVNFIDQMLRDETAMRMEEVLVPAHRGAVALRDLLPRSRHYVLVAAHAGSRWEFNPADDYLVRPGTALVFMASPDGRAEVERLLSI